MWKKVTMVLHIDDSVEETLKTITHHAERLIDLDGWPEIKGVYAVKVEDYDINS